jgi:hypothetical protein
MPTQGTTAVNAAAEGAGFIIGKIELFVLIKNLNNGAEFL